ncbi:FAD binding domain-containing protein [Rhizobium sp. C4]|uniref:FAD binding domain-containing protein n=1 Tax=Rhizobium sp. C4 TaxID=1349800 RepID=UPI001E658FA3|nr:xanthine dehydrogenase family protein subunit M [Rhizobium sp. C4]MCD2174349.1 xanthine dehydrogenase family protein subunit M [Rhizobium sp. C4]
MKRFDYIRPVSVDDAVAAFRPGAAYLGGGTNLLDLMKIGVIQPDTLIDLGRIAELGPIEMLPGGGARVGALVRNSDLAYDRAFAAAFPMVAEAILAGASGQLRNAATVGGNLMQKTRCAYFQDPHSACNRREPGSGCAARGGDNANLAVLGWSDACIATNPSDMCVPLAALGAVVEVQGPAGKRDIPIADFHQLPGDQPETETALQPGELVIAIRLPTEAADFARNARYLKVRERTSFAFALVSVAAALKLDGQKIIAARIALGAVAAKPWRVTAAEDLLVGQAPTEEAFARAADALLEGARASGDNGYKIELARRAVIRALQMSAAGTPKRMPALPASPFGDVAEEHSHV